MNPKRIIPCLDLKDGRVVKGVNFVNLVDAGDPVQIAKAYEKEGADELILLDITASQKEDKKTLKLIREIVGRVQMPITVGGGIDSVEKAEELIASGASKISIGSAAVKNPDFINELAEKIKSEKIVIGIDGKYNKEKESYQVYINGGRENTSKDVVDWAKEVEERGAGEILLTSMDGDGTKEGYDIKLTSLVAESVSIPVIASGGAGKKEDFLKALTQGKASGALAASLFHFKELKIKDLKDYLVKNNINIKE